MTASQYEKRNHSTAEIPYSLYSCRIPEYFLSVPPHWHNEFEINLITAGSSFVIIDGEKLSVKAGDIIFIQSNKVHSIYPDENNFQAYETMVFNENMIDCGTSTRSGSIADKIKSGEFCISPVISPERSGYTEIRSCITDIITNMRLDTAENDILVKSRLLELIYIFIKYDLARSGRSDDRLSAIKPALKFISEHFAENITIIQLAAVSHLSESYFMFLFKKFTGHTAVEHITKVRLEEVCRLLRTTDISITEISGLCGFSNISNFNRHFLKSVGTAPNEYRKKYGFGGG